MRLMELPPADEILRTFGPVYGVSPEHAQGRGGSFGWGTDAGSITHVGLSFALDGAEVRVDTRAAGELKPERLLVWQLLPRATRRISRPRFPVRLRVTRASGRVTIDGARMQTTVLRCDQRAVARAELPSGAWIEVDGPPAALRSLQLVALDEPSLEEHLRRRRERAAAAIPGPRVVAAEPAAFSARDLVAAFGPIYSLARPTLRREGSSGLRAIPTDGVPKAIGLSYSIPSDGRWLEVTTRSAAEPSLPLRDFGDLVTAAILADKESAEDFPFTVTVEREVHRLPVDDSRAVDFTVYACGSRANGSAQVGDRVVTLACPRDTLDVVALAPASGNELRGRLVRWRGSRRRR